MLVLLLASVLRLSLLLAGLTLRGVQSSSPCAGATFPLLWRDLRRCDSSPNPSGGWLGRLPDCVLAVSWHALPRRCAAAIIMPWRMLPDNRVRVRVPNDRNGCSAQLLVTTLLVFYNRKRHGIPSLTALERHSPCLQIAL